MQEIKAVHVVYLCGNRSRSVGYVRVWEGVEIEAERCGEVHGLRLSNPLQEENHRPQRTNSVLSHMILYTP